jgi:hypothetical protein
VQEELEFVVARNVIASGGGNCFAAPLEAKIGFPAAIIWRSGCTVDRGSIPRRNVSVRFEVFTAVTMKNGVFWDVRTQSVLHRRHITSPLHSPVG